MFFLLMDGKPISKHSSQEIAQKKANGYIAKLIRDRKYYSRALRAALGVPSYKVVEVAKGTEEFKTMVKKIEEYKERLKK